MNDTSTDLISFNNLIKVMILTEKDTVNLIRFKIKNLKVNCSNLIRNLLYLFQLILLLLFVLFLFNATNNVLFR